MPTRLLTPGYTRAVLTIEWRNQSPARQVRELRDRLGSPGWVVVRFGGCAAGSPVPWRVLEEWRRSRAVTVADIAGELASPEQDVALCSDIVVVREEAALWVGHPSAACPGPGVLWAAGRAGRRALRRVLLDGGAVPASEAVDLGLAHAIVAAGSELPLPREASLSAAMAARDLLRARAPGGAGLDLELATFRMLFAAGVPREGAAAFLEKRPPEWTSRGNEDK